MERLLKNGNIVRDDIEHVYSGLFLAAFTAFEALIEDLFFGLLKGTITSKANHRTVSIKPAALSNLIVYGDRSYIDWLPYKEKTIARAKRFFKNGGIFSTLTKQQILQIREYQVIRNALAHKSQIAQQNFQKLISPLPLLPTEKTPSGYLRNVPNAAASQTQYEIMIIELQFIANHLCK